MLCKSCSYSTGTTQSSDTHFLCGARNDRLVNSPDKCYSYEGDEFPVDVAIITATEEENRAVLRGLTPRKLKTKKPLHRRDITWQEMELIFNSKNKKRRLRIVSAAARLKGLPAAAVQATLACQIFRPRYLVMLGITAGKHGETKLGDIVTPSLLFDFGAGKWDGDVFRPEPHQLDIDEVVYRNCEHISLHCQGQLDRISNSWAPTLPERARLKVHYSGHMVSGASVVNSDKVWDRILGIDKKVMAIDMEAYAVALAGRQSGIHGLKVLIAKSVCDYAVGKTDDGQAYAAHTSIEFFKLYAELFIRDD